MRIKENFPKRQLLALLKSNEINLREIELQRDSIVVTHSLDISCDQDSDSLSGMLSASGIEKQDIILLVDRRDVSLRLLQVPDFPDDELNDLIPLQAESRIGRPLNDVYYDYLITPAGLSENRYATFVTAPNGRIDEIKSRLNSAGLNVVSAVIPGFLLPQLAQSEGVSADVFIRQGLSELVVSAHGIPIASMSFRTPENQQDIAEKIFINWQRLQSGLPTELSEKTLQEIRVKTIGVLNFDLTSLGKHFSNARVIFGELQSYGEHAEFALAMLKRGDRQSRIDLVQPRLPQTSQFYRYRLLIRVAAIIILGVSLFSLWLLQEHRALDQKIVRDKEKETEFNELIERGTSVLQTKDVVDSWEELNVDWSYEIARFCDLLPPADRLYLTRLQVDVSPKTGVAVLRISGKARTNSDVTALNSLLVTNSNYVMHPVSIQPSTSDQFYPTTFDLEAELKNVEVDLAEKELTFNQL